jgi:phosphoribosylanthranilate isomerase
VTAVKICGLTNVTDARWAWQCGADLLGFIFIEATPRCVVPDTVEHIVHTLRAEGCRLRTVGVFSAAPIEWINPVAEQCSLDLIQWHDESPLLEPEKLVRPLILAWRVRGRPSWDRITRTTAWAYLLDSYGPGRLGGTGQTWAWDAASPYEDRPERLIVAGGLTPDNVAEAIRRTRAWGVDVSSGVEAEPRHKSPSKVQRFIDNVRQVEFSSVVERDIQ